MTIDALHEDMEETIDLLRAQLRETERQREGLLDDLDEMKLEVRDLRRQAREAEDSIPPSVVALIVEWLARSTAAQRSELIDSVGRISTEAANVLRALENSP